MRETNIQFKIDLLDVAFVIMCILKLLNQISWAWYVILIPLIIKLIVAFILKILFY